MNLPSKKTRLYAHLYILCHYKNTIISLTAINGNVLKQWSTKSLKKTKFKKNTPYNVQLITSDVKQYIQTNKIKFLNVYIKGRGLGRYQVLKNLRRASFRIKYVILRNTLPFNGCRQPQKKRR
jgi:small subunit ribosomal protein S11